MTIEEKWKKKWARTPWVVKAVLFCATVWGGAELAQAFPMLKFWVATLIILSPLAILVFFAIRNLVIGLSDD